MNTPLADNVHIVAIKGSTRPNSFTAKAVDWIAKTLAAEQISIDCIDPAILQLPFPGHPDITGDAATLVKKVSVATGVIISTPEYHGGFSSAIKLVIENLGYPSVLSGKPVALLGVASGQIGAVKSLESLRSICSHVGAIVLPDAVSIPNIHTIFDAEGRCIDLQSVQRMQDLSNNLLDYIKNHICPKMTLEAIAREQSSLHYID